jgi:hypothetical protein
MLTSAAKIPRAVSRLLPANSMRSIRCSFLVQTPILLEIRRSCALSEARHQAAWSESA